MLLTASRTTSLLFFCWCALLGIHLACSIAKYICLSKESLKKEQYAVFNALRLLRYSRYDLSSRTDICRDLFDEGAPLSLFLILDGLTIALKTLYNILLPSRPRKPGPLLESFEMRHGNGDPRRISRLIVGYSGDEKHSNNTDTELAIRCNV